MVIAYTIGRILIPLLFIVSGVQNALNIGTLAQILSDTNVPIPEEIVPYLGGIPKYQALGYAIVAIEIICGVMVLIGLKPRWGALILVVFTASKIIFVHHFWDMSGDAMIANMTEALKYLSIVGGLLMVVSVGSAPNPMDRHD